MLQEDNQIKTPLEALIEKEQLITGLRAIRLAAIQDSLVEELDIQNQYFGTMTTLRVADPNNIPPFNSPASPKPSNIYSKTSPLVGGYIPVDPIFTRLDAARNPMGHHMHDDLAKQDTIQVKWTLYEIMRRCDNAGDLHVDWSNIPIVKLTFKENKGPLDFKGEFIVNLGEEKSIITDINDKRIFTRSFDDPHKNPYLIADIVAERFDIDEFIYYVYPIYYKLNRYDNLERVKPLMVFAKNNMPIISDWDKDLESMPLEDIFIANKTASKEFNTFDNIEQRRLLLTATKTLFEQLCERKKPSVHPAINNFFANKYNFLKLLNGNLVAMAGVITPYEFLRNMLANYFHNQSCDFDYYKDPFQHGPHNRSPIVDPNINAGIQGARLHIYQGQIIYTTDEEQRIKLYLVEGFLENNFIHVPSTADMQYWGAIIEKQVNCLQSELISVETLEAYFKYQITELQLGNLLPIYNMEKWHTAITSHLSTKQSSLVMNLPIFKEYLQYCKKLPIEHLFTPIVTTYGAGSISSDGYLQRISSDSSNIESDVDTMHIPGNRRDHQLLLSYTQYSTSVSAKEPVLASVDSEVPKDIWHTGLAAFMTTVAEDLIESAVPEIQSDQNEIEQQLLPASEQDDNYYLSSRRKSKAIPTN